MQVRVWLVGLLFFCSISLISCQSWQEQQTQALIALYNSTGGDYWDIKDQWLNGDPCLQRWYGVICRSYAVYIIDLRTNNLTGTIPNEFKNLPSLAALGLCGNKNLVGTVPDTFGDFNNLQILALNNTSLSGSIPGSWQEANALATLDLRNAQFSGSLPDWSNMKNLTYLNIANNNITGTIPDSWSTSTSLKHVYLNQNGLSGTIPQFLNSTRRGYLDLSDNYLEGTLPDFLQRSWPANLENNYFSCPLADWCSAPPLGDGSCEPCFSAPVESYSGTPTISRSASITRSATRTPVSRSNSYSQTPSRTGITKSHSRTPAPSNSPIPLIKPSYSILGLTVISFSLLMCLVCCAIAFACVSKPKPQESVGLLNE